MGGGGKGEWKIYSNTSFVTNPVTPSFGRLSVFTLEHLRVSQDLTIILGWSQPSNGGTLCLFVCLLVLGLGGQTTFLNKMNIIHVNLGRAYIPGDVSMIS